MSPTTKRRLCLTILLVALVLARPVLDHVPTTAPSLSRWRMPSLSAWLFDAPVEATYTPTPIKSIPHVSVSFPAGVTPPNATASLSPTVTLAASTLVFEGMFAGENASGRVNCPLFATATLTSGSVVTASMHSSCNGGNGNARWNGTVVEFLPQFVKSRGCGVVTIPYSAASGSVTIPAVTPTKTILSFTGWQMYLNGQPGNLPWDFSGDLGDNTGHQLTPLLTLTNATTITGSLQGQTADAAQSEFIGYCYLEIR